MTVKEFDLVCFSHLRWNFVFQRPQHLLTRFASLTRVFYIEEPEFTDQSSFNSIHKAQDNIWVVVPKLQHGLNEKEIDNAKKDLLIKLFAEHSVDAYVFWYYTPMSLAFTSGFVPKLTVFDCMDELSAFKFAPPSLLQREEELIKKSDIVFTGGESLYRAKKNRHPAVYPFPSSIDKDHFGGARSIKHDPIDQQSISHPRLGFYGVIDERLDIDLLGRVAESKPDWQFIIIGPVVKIDPASLPHTANIHYLGPKSYQELPGYLAGWDIALIPFALNDSTKFISPTKTPEYLSAGKPVISSSIQDVISPYAELGLVNIADNADDFIKAAESELEQSSRDEWLAKVDKFLADISWDKTWSEMVHLMNTRLADISKDSISFNLNSKETIYV